MHKNWTGDLVGLMHDNKISHSELAAELGVSREYVSMVLNEKRMPAGAEDRFMKAFLNIVDKKRNASE